MKPKTKLLTAAITFFCLFSFSGNYQPIQSKINAIKEKSTNDIYKEIASQSLSVAEQYLPHYDREMGEMINSQANNASAEEAFECFYFIDVMQDMGSRPASISTSPRRATHG